MDPRNLPDVDATSKHSPMVLTLASRARSKIVDNIEHKTGKHVRIDTVETGDVLAKCHSQDQSTLFAQLPRELRNYIWAFATAPIEDDKHAYETHKFYYRPGHVAKLKTDYSLLLTCRRAWLEAHALPMLQAEHSFWYYRAAPDGRSKQWMAGLTALNHKYFGTLHLYVQMFAIERQSPRANALKGFFLPSPTDADIFQPLKFHITIRHTDWWNWETEAPLSFKYEWLQAILDSPDLRRTETFILELETLDYKVQQLDPIVRHIQQICSKELDTHIIVGQPAKTRFILAGQPIVSSWTGPTNLDGRTYNQYKDKQELNYHVVTLTWHLQFPQYPKAYIPKLRLVEQFLQERPVSQAPASTTIDLQFNRPSFADRILSVDIPEYEPSFSLGYDLAVARFDRHQMGLRRSGRIRRPGRISGSVWDGDGMNVREYQAALWDMQDMHGLQAKAGEYSRRQQFWRSMKPVWNECWSKRFAAEKSLLRLEDIQQDYSARDRLRIEEW